MLGPRINAAGRIDHGKKAVELLCSANAEELIEMATAIDDQNQTRRDLDRGITTEALQFIQDKNLQNHYTSVLYHPHWHKGVIGIVASRLIETYHRPTVVFTKSGDKLAGSARSVPGFDLYAALEKCTDILEQFGGHMYAAGMTLKEERFDEFADKFEQVVRQRIHPDMLIPQISFDTEIKLADINPKFYRILKQFEPHGPGNLAPMFVTHGLQDTGFCKGVGQDEAHLKLYAFEPSTGAKLSGIAFGFGHLAEDLRNGATFSAAYHIEENVWNGNTTLQLMIKDLKLSDR
jgi:single-stranded-DNA-specific exonuclease